jgi:hypothetical protein
MLPMQALSAAADSSARASGLKVIDDLLGEK